MRRGLAIVTALVFALIGMSLIVLGARLMWLGGTFWYLPLGGGMVAVALLLWRGYTGVRGVFALLLTAILAWALWDAGWNVWGLEARLLMPAVMGLWLLAVVRGRGAVLLGGAIAVSLLVLGAAFVDRGRLETQGTLARASDAAGPPADAAGADWPQYGGGARADRYSSLTQITPANAARLDVAWTVRTGDTRNRGFFEAPALKIGDTLYICTASAWVLALDPVTGREKWKFVPPKRGKRAASCRGITHAVLDAVPAGAPCRARIFAPSAGPSIVALDAATGTVCADFGQGGFIDLTQGLGHIPGPLVGTSSPPAYLRGRLVVGMAVADNRYDREPSGVVRGFDARTGALVWSWDMGRVPANKPLGAGEIHTQGTPNAWGPITADPDLGLAYVPTGNPSPDYYGGQRRAFDDRYGSALVALDVETGLARWHFQTVHHDLWDMDMPVGPTLIDFAGKPALLQTTKRGEMFILDRVSGKPLTRVVEKPAPKGDVKGEYYAPTQPWNVGLESLPVPDIRESDAWGATLLDQLLCRVSFRALRYDGAFTPPSLQGSLVHPGYFGIADWGGAAVDAGRGLAFLNLSYMPWVVRLIPQDEALRRKLIPAWDGKRDISAAVEGDIRPQYNTPYAVQIHPWMNVLGVPCLTPPLGRMAAMDLHSRKILWTRSLGTARHNGPLGLDHPLALPTGMYSLGGPVATAGGVVFIAATFDRTFRALDAASGRLLWQAPLPAAGTATPSTYLGRDGRQYVVIAAGGHWGIGQPVSDHLIAYALPR